MTEYDRDIAIIRSEQHLESISKSLKVLANFIELFEDEIKN